MLNASAASAMARMYVQNPPYIVFSVLTIPLYASLHSEVYNNSPAVLHHFQGCPAKR